MYVAFAATLLLTVFQSSAIQWISRAVTRVEKTANSAGQLNLILKLFFFLDKPVHCKCGPGSLLILLVWGIWGEVGGGRAAVLKVDVEELWSCLRFRSKHFSLKQTFKSLVSMEWVQTCKEKRCWKTNKKHSKHASVSVFIVWMISLQGLCNYIKTTLFFQRLSHSHILICTSAEPLSCAVVFLNLRKHFIYNLEIPISHLSLIAAPDHNFVKSSSYTQKFFLKSANINFKQRNGKRMETRVYWTFLWPFSHTAICSTTSVCGVSELQMRKMQVFENKTASQVFSHHFEVS